MVGPCRTTPRIATLTHHSVNHTAALIVVAVAAVVTFHRQFPPLMSPSARVPTFSTVYIIIDLATPIRIRVLCFIIQKLQVRTPTRSFASLWPWFFLFFPPPQMYRRSRVRMQGLQSDAGFTAAATTVACLRLGACCIRMELHPEHPVHICLLRIVSIFAIHY